MSQEFSHPGFIDQTTSNEMYVVRGMNSLKKLTLSTFDDEFRSYTYNRPSDPALTISVPSKLKRNENSANLKHYKIKTYLYRHNSRRSSEQNDRRNI